MIQPHALTASGCQPTDAADGCRSEGVLQLRRKSTAAYQVERSLAKFTGGRQVVRSRLLAYDIIERSQFGAQHCLLGASIVGVEFHQRAP